MPPGEASVASPAPTDVASPSRRDRRLAPRSRLQVVDGATTLEILRSCGCGIRSFQEPWIDTTTAFGEAVYHITLVWAMLEKATMRERIKRVNRPEFPGDSKIPGAVHFLGVMGRPLRAAHAFQGASRD